MIDLDEAPELLIGGPAGAAFGVAAGAPLAETDEAASGEGGDGAHEAAAGPKLKARGGRHRPGAWAKHGQSGPAS